MRPVEKEGYRRLLVEWNDRVAKVWDCYFVPAMAPIRERLLDLAEVKSGDRVLDVGTGPGGAALAAARRVGETGRVVGVDTSPKMLKRARENAAKSGLPALEFRLMDSSSLEFTDGSFDAVISCFGQPETPWDVPPALLEWRRVLVPGGRFCHCGEGDSGDEELSDWFPKLFEKYKVRNPGPGLSASRRLRSLASKEAKKAPTWRADLLESAGFTAVRHFTESFEVSIPARAWLEPSVMWGKLDEYLAMAPRVRQKFRREAIKALKPLETTKAPVAFYVALRAKS